VITLKPTIILEYQEERERESLQQILANSTIITVRERENIQQILANSTIITVRERERERERAYNKF
jgi:hypothetical protein